MAGVLLLVVGLVAVSLSNRMIAREQEKTAAARDREEQRANEAEEMFRQARQAVDALVEMSEEELADNMFVAHARKRLLQTALLFYQDFIDQRRGDAASQADLAAVEQRVKGILRELEILHRDTQTDQLYNPVVARELRLSEAQYRQVKELLSSWERDKQALRPTLEALDDDDRRRRFVELAERRESDLETVLTPQQLTRLGQLALQSQNVWAFKQPEVVDALQLTGEQRAAIRKIERARFAPDVERDREPRAVHGARPNGGPTPDARTRRERPRDDGRRDTGFAKEPRRDRGWRGEGPPDRGPPHLADAQRDKQAMAEVLALLTNDQRARWHELTGQPVDGLYLGRRDDPHRPHGPMPPPNDSER